MAADGFKRTRTYRSDDGWETTVISNSPSDDVIKQAARLLAAKIDQMPISKEAREYPLAS